MLATGRPMMPRRLGAVAAAPWHSSQTESKISAPELASPEMAVPVEPAALPGDWAIAFQARIAPAAMEIAASKRPVLSAFLTLNIQFVRVMLVGIKCTYKLTISPIANTGQPRFVRRIMRRHYRAAAINSASSSTAFRPLLTRTPIVYYGPSESSDAGLHRGISTSSENGRTLRGICCRDAHGNAWHCRRVHCRRYTANFRRTQADQGGISSNHRKPVPAHHCRRFGFRNPNQRALRAGKTRRGTACDRYSPAFTDFFRL